MGAEVKYRWTTSIFNYKGKGEEWTTGYLETKEAARSDLIAEGTSGFILLDNPDSEGDIQEVEFIKIIKDEKGNAIVSEVISDETAGKLYFDKAFEVWKEDF
ncbi:MULTISPECIES: hypothetical protein [Bacillus]|uniref:hypothetical protein n=1 Tax=Bacillus TaxID=1386 RepID=UPI0001DA5D54|nr:MULTISPECIES: hypothetical protein [Bacillus]EFI65115.1 hypothetical protein BCSJ1_09428 [Bacillus cereus SJ1]MBR9656997.1 hypothetical protein [Bacillus cereus]MCU4899357.1 hypothetical protein [Bacillus cereus]MCU5313624.1 hypothetical protein [Bacillus cereus]MCU5441336.1 hypothetical protein [Bacillus cereus]